MQVYLDNSATTRPYDEVAAKMNKMLTENWANPSSLYPMGLDAELAVREAREQVAKAMGRRDKNIYFTSCGTESDNMGIFGAAKKGRRQGNEIITTVVEHPAVLEAVKVLEKEGYTIKYAGVDSEGRVDPNEIKSMVTEKTILISVMTVNNETGTIQPINEINKIKGNALFHTDAVQAMGKLDLGKINADMISVSGHKIHGPKGTGAIFIREGLVIQPFISGGGQERNMRSGTENTPGIAGFGEAARITHQNFDTRVNKMIEAGSYLKKGIIENIDDIVINSPDDACPSVLNISFPGTRGEVILHTLEQDGIMVSTGSACSSGSGGGSHVLKAMGRTPNEIEGAIRFSFSEFNTVEQMDFVLDRLVKAVNRFRKLGRLQ